MTEFKVLFDDQPAPRAHLERVEEINVEQEIDMAWEARIRFQIKMDERGRWEGEQTLTEPFSRMRIDVRVNQGFVPLIDGPVVDYESSKQAQPGQSTITLVVQDDSVLLNRGDVLDRFDNRSDHEIAEQLFDDPVIEQTDIASTPPPADGLPHAVVQRGTAMQLLRRLARRQGMHAYVLPGEQSGESIGCFKPLPTGPSILPPLILTGPQRNMDSFSMTHDFQRASRVRAVSIRAVDKQIVRGSAAPTDFDLLGSRPARETSSPQSQRVVGVGYGTSIDLDQQARAAARALSYTFEASGQVRSDCYKGVLRPYQVVSVRGVNQQWSGTYVIRRVTHTLTRSSYGQSFDLLRDAESAPADESPLDIIRRLF